jgi:hypothetical protein
MNEQGKSDSAQRMADWITLLLAAVFVILGAGILAGLILADRVFFQGNIRVIAGLVLAGYGLVRGGMIIRRLRA